MGIFDKVKTSLTILTRTLSTRISKTFMMTRRMTLIRPTAQSPRSHSAISALLRDRRRSLRRPI